MSQASHPSAIISARLIGRNGAAWPGAGMAVSMRRPIRLRRAGCNHPLFVIHPLSVIPAKAGTQDRVTDTRHWPLGPGFRRDDGLLYRVDALTRGDDHGKA